MPSLRPASALALFLIHPAAFAQLLSLSVINYEQVSEAPAASNIKATYRVVIGNSGPATPPVTGAVTSLSPSIKVSGTGILHFASVPSNGVVASNNTVTFVVPANSPINFSQLEWTFEANPIAKPGPNQTVPVGAPVTLNGSASTNPGGSGALTYHWQFVSIPAASSAVLEEPSNPIASFTADVAGSYQVKLTVSNGTASGSATTTVSATSTQFPPPVANAGLNETAIVGRPVILNGSGSTSPDGLPLTYSWSLISRPGGSTAALQAKNTAFTYFTPDKPGSYEAELIVNDGVPSSPSTVMVTTQMAAPVANAGTAQAVNVGATVQLNGAASTDANGLPLTYLWTLLSVPSGSTAKLSNATAVNPTFVADRSGAYVAQLIVNDGQYASAPATVTVTTQMAAPTANAGQSETVSVGAKVTLNGSGTDPQNLPLSYRWSLINKPFGSAAALSNPGVSNPSFTADIAGAYVAQLIVSDGTLKSSPSTVTISTQCLQPFANAGTNQTVSVGDTVSLSGAASTGACGAPLLYIWTLNRPATSSAILSNSVIASPTFVPDIAGTYIAQLIVNNGVASSNPATVTITASGGSGPPGTTGGAVQLPAGVIVSQFQSAPVSLTLSEPAPSNVVVTLQSSDTSTFTVSPAKVTIAAGDTSPATSPRLTALNAGLASLTASAPGFTSATESIQVSANFPAVLTFTPASILINGASTQNLTLSIANPAPATGLTVELSSNGANVATVPASVKVPANSTSVMVPVTGVAPGNATITASATGYQSTTAYISVYSNQGVSVTWYGACWVNATIYGITGNFQAIDLLVSSTQPIQLQGTLFYAANCDASQGQDNMNDDGMLTNPGNIIQGFSHHPDVIPSSAMYWIGPQTGNGLCAPGAPCSGCVNYTKKTPYCSALR